MASGTLVHFGLDQCFRMRVLESAGFSVADCGSIEDLSAELLRNPDALMLEEDPVEQVRQALSLSMSFPEIPLIQFGSPLGVAPGAADLTVPSFTAPEIWLREVDALIQHAHAVIAQSRRIRAPKSIKLRGELSPVCAASAVSHSSVSTSTDTR